MHSSLGDQLKKAVKGGKIKVRYPDGYKKWKTKFDHFYKLTGNVKQTLDIIYGPNGGVSNYKGSLYRNANFDASSLTPAKSKSHKHNKKNKSFNFIKNRKKQSNDS